MTAWMADSILDRRTSEQDKRRAERRSRALKVECIKVLILQGKVKESIDLAEAIGITPKQYRKIVESLNEIG